MTETLEMQLRSAKLTLLVDELRAIEAALDKRWPSTSDRAEAVAEGRKAIELERELLITGGWRP